MEARDEDWVNQLFVASTHAYVFFFSDKGKVYVKKVYEIPPAARNAKGRAIVNFVGMEPGEKVAAITPVTEIEEGTFVVTLTQRGQIKKTEAHRVRELSREGHHRRQDRGGRPAPRAPPSPTARASIVIATRRGMSIRFAEDQVRPMGRATVGVKGDRALDEGDHVVGLGGRRATARDQRARGLRERLRQADAARGVPPPEPRRQGRHPHRRQRAQRPRGRHRVGEARRRGDARDRSRADHAHQGQRDPRDRAQCAGRAGHGVDESERVVAIEALAESAESIESIDGEEAAAPEGASSLPPAGDLPPEGEVT